MCQRSGFDRVQGLGFLGFRVPGLRFLLEDLGFKMSGPRFGTDPKP